MNKFNTSPTNTHFFSKLHRGFTIVELMVTVAIAGIILTIAAPSLNVFVVSMRVDNEVTEMHRLLLTARNSAINTGLNTTVCPLDSSNICTDNWEDDISVFTNTTATTNEMDGSDILIKVKSAIKAEDTFKISTAGAIIYSPTGRTLNGTINKLTYCPYGYADSSNGIDISTSGRTYMGTENSVGKYVDRNNNIFTCI